MSRNLFFGFKVRLCQVTRQLHILTRRLLCLLAYERLDRSSAPNESPSSSLGVAKGTTAVGNFDIFAVFLGVLPILHSPSPILSHLSFPFQFQYCKKYQLAAIGDHMPFRWVAIPSLPFRLESLVLTLIIAKPQGKETEPRTLDMGRQGGLILGNQAMQT